jgi:streptogramin lyase
MEKYLTRALLLVILIGQLALLGLAIHAFVDRSTSEPRLNSKGSAYELNLDSQGRLWISDFKTGEVWGVDPANGTYEKYTVSGSPIDARQADGYLWWGDGLSNVLGRVSTSDGTSTQWQVPDAYGFLGTSLDDQGRLYATDSSNPYLYRLDPNLAELCTYTLPGFGASNYLFRDGDTLWLDDSFDSTILRLQISDDSLTWWSLPEASSPFGMVVDTQGNLWYADQGKKVLAQLNPTTDQLVSYALPTGNYPQMIAIQSGAIWYTEQSLPSIGRLDPLTADHTMDTLTIHEQLVTPSCSSISPASSGKVSITTGSMSWGKQTYTPIVNTSGWEIYQLPKGSDPWGIAVTDFGYVVDSGRQVLMRFVPSQEASSTQVNIPPITPTPISTPAVVPTSISTPAIVPSITSPPDQLRYYLPLIFNNYPTAP